MSENENAAPAAESAARNDCPVRETFDKLQDDVSELRDDASGQRLDIEDTRDQIEALTDAIVEIIGNMEPSAAGEVIFRLRTLERESPDPEHSGYRRRMRDLCDRANSRDR